MSKNVDNLIKILGSKWTILIINELVMGPKRFGNLQRSLVGISPKVLSIRLKELEEEGIVNKRTFPVLPARVEYSLTAKGQALRVIIQKMFEWGQNEAEFNESYVVHATH